MRWIETKFYAFYMQRPQYIEEHHILAIGLRSDFRVFYAYVPVPEHPPDRAGANRELISKFNSFLEDDGNTMKYTVAEFHEVAERFMHGRHSCEINPSTMDFGEEVTNVQS